MNHKAKVAMRRAEALRKGREMSRNTTILILEAAAKEIERLEDRLGTVKALEARLMAEMEWRRGFEEGRKYVRRSAVDTSVVDKIFR